MTKILGVPFSNLTMSETVERLHNEIEEHKETEHTFHVVTANPEMVMNGVKNDDFMDVLHHSELITPDGIGIVIGSKMINEPLKERVAGYDLIHNLLSFRKNLSKKTTLYCVGAKEDVIKLAIRRLRQLYDNIEIVGYHHGFFEPNSEIEKEIITDIGNKKPDILLVGLGSPRQENFIFQHKEKLHAKVAIGCGGTFDVLAGVVKRAPVLFQKMGLEWFYRLMQQPSRWKRQLVLPQFLIYVSRAKKQPKD